MKKLFYILISSLVLSIAAAGVASASIIYFYQPEAPAEEK